MKVFIFLFSIYCSLFSLDVDPKLLQQIINENPQAYNEKVLLAKYYEKNNNDSKALSLIEDVLNNNPRDKNALSLKEFISRKQKNKEVFKEANLIQPINSEDAQKRLTSYYNANNYQFYSTLYQALIDTKINIEDAFHIKAAYIYLWDARYEPSQNALDRLTHDNNIDAAKIRADICYYTGKYACSEKLYEKLYNSSYDINYAIKLLNSHIYLGQTQKAQRLHNFIYRKYPNNKELIEIGKKLSSLKDSYLLSKKEAYEKSKSVEDLDAYANTIFSSEKKDEVLKLLNEHNKNNATESSLILEAKYLTWMGSTKKALEILQKSSLNNDLQAKLMLGQIYSWENKFEEAKRYLNEVISKTKDNSLLYNAKKAQAYIYMWEKESDTAKTKFTELSKENPSDAEVKEALMELNHDYAGLIKIYQDRVKTANNSQDIKRLGELYVSNKQPQIALKYLKEYVQDNPEDLEATKNLAQLLIGNKEYYQGFGYLEYYATQKKSSEANILLAKNYYWSGFSKEALDVLDGVLRDDSNNKEAIELKAQILKISPRFTTSNGGATIGMYFDDLGSKQLQLADSLYFNSHYKASLMYYESYLEKNPTNHEVRYRYALALENVQEHAKAEGEFYLMFWTKESDELRYHYAYNMMKNNKPKEAKKLFLELKKSSYGEIDPNLNTFLESWKDARQSQNFLKYSSHYDKSFSKNDMWAYKQQQNFASTTFVSVGIYDPISKAVDNFNYIIKFYQEYSTNKGKEKGYKTLYVKCDANKTECKISKEQWEAGEYKKSLLLTPLIEQRLQDIEVLESTPLAMMEPVGKKKILLLKSIMTYS